MITIIAGTDRDNSKSRKIADLAINFLNLKSVKSHLIDLAKLPRKLFHPKNYKETPVFFKKHQEIILKTNGILTIVS